VTATLSVEAVQVRWMADDEVAFPARFDGTVGAMVSPPRLACTSNVVLAVMLLESRAVTVMRLSPDFRSRPLTFQAVVPRLTPSPPRSFDQVRALTDLPEAAEAVPLRLKVATVVV
jgi:hypothetical protein